MTTQLAQISASQAQKEVTANENFAAVTPNALFARKYTTTTGLTWGYYGGIFPGTFSLIADGTLTLTNAATNYIECDNAGTLYQNISAFTAGRNRLYSVVCAGGVITSYTDYRQTLGINVVNLTTLGAAVATVFNKALSTAPGFTKTGAGTISVLAGTSAMVAGALVSFAVDTAVTMPSLTAGTDYAIYFCTDGTVRADANFSAPTGYTTANSRKIGGFHYAPGGNATQLSKAAVAAGTAIGAQTVTADKWALYLLSVDVAGTITVTPATGNVAGYVDEATAIVAMPAMPASTALMGYITVLTKAATAWIAGTDALAGGASGNVATTTNYYPSTGSAMGLTLSRGTTDTSIASTAFTYYLGGDTTPAINSYSIWDIKFRPKASDPRGLMLVPGKRVWGFIYFLGVDHIANGPSRYNVTIADNGNPPKIPLEFGGDGTVAYPGCGWWRLAEVLSAYGFRFPTIDEFAAMAYGTTENAAAIGATDPVSTILRAESTSKCGMMLSTGNMHTWGAHFGGPYGTAAWTANTSGRGSTYDLPDAVLLGGNWGLAASAGSRCSLWANAPTSSSTTIGARGVCDHLQLD